MISMAVPSFPTEDQIYSVLSPCISTLKFLVNDQNADRDDQILIFGITINNVDCVFINVYNANTETEQSVVLNSLSPLLEIFGITPEK